MDRLFGRIGQKSSCKNSLYRLDGYFVANLGRFYARLLAWVDSIMCCRFGKALFNAADLGRLYLMLLT